LRFNVEFLVIAYFIGLFVDWVFQTQWQANNKSMWKAFIDQASGRRAMPDRRLSALALLSHSLVYAALTAALTQAILSGFTLSVFAAAQTWWMFAVLFVTHAIIDSRIPVKWVMHMKGMTGEQIADIPNYGFMHIGIDHRLHELVLFVMAFFVIS
jgi:hypothetical protein